MLTVQGNSLPDEKSGEPTSGATGESTQASDEGELKPAIEPDLAAVEDAQGALEQIQEPSPKRDATKTAKAPAKPANVILVGLMGSGKTTIGLTLSRLLGYGMIDTDTLVEQHFGMPIAEVFATKGEAAFREAERQALGSLAHIRNHVIAVGGGAVLADANWDLLSRLGVIVWLNTPPAELARRLERTPEAITRRPLLADLTTRQSGLKEGLTERLSNLLEGRRERYARAAVQLDEPYATPEATAVRLRSILVRDGYVLAPRARRPYSRWGQ